MGSSKREGIIYFRQGECRAGFRFEMGLMKDSRERLQGFFQALRVHDRFGSEIGEGFYRNAFGRQRAGMNGQRDSVTQITIRVDSSVIRHDLYNFVQYFAAYAIEYGCGRQLL
jgi:hypothetical protein